MPATCRGRRERSAHDAGRWDRSRGASEVFARFYELCLFYKGCGQKGHHGCVSHTILKLSNSPHDLTHLSICYQHCTTGLAWSGRPGPDCEAVLQRVCSCAAQPQCSLKEPRTALLLRHEVDRLGSASSASNKSGSCAWLLSLHASVGATICGARTDASTQLERVARCRLRFSAAHRQA